MSSEVRRSSQGYLLRGEHGVVLLLGAGTLGAGATGALFAAGQLAGGAARHVWIAQPSLQGIWGAVVHPLTPLSEWAETPSAVSPALFWLAGVPLLLAALALAVLVTTLTWRVLIPGTAHVGLAEGIDERRDLGAGAARRQAQFLRPSVRAGKVAMTEIALPLGHSVRTRQPLYMNLRQSLGLVAQPGGGKTTSLMGVFPIDWPGPCVVTMTQRPDALAMSLCQPDFERPRLVFDPEALVPNCPYPMRFNLLAGCSRIEEARLRARAIVEAGVNKRQMSGNIEFFIGEASTVLAGWMHAAELQGGGLEAAYRWSRRWGDDEPVDILRAAGGDSADLGTAVKAIHDVHGPQQSGTAGELRNALACLENPSVRAAFGGAGSGEELDAAAFIREGARLYVLGSGDVQRSIGPLVSVALGEVVKAAKRQAALQRSLRLDPPLLLDLDEVTNIAPLPELPSIISAGGGSGIVTAWAAQGLSQLEDRWGQAGREAIWQATTCKLWFGGSSEFEAMRGLSEMAGMVDEEIFTEDRPSFWVMHREEQRHRLSRSLRQVPVVSVERLAHLRRGRAMLYAQATRPVEVELRPWWQRRDVRGRIRASLDEFERITGIRAA